MGSETSLVELFAVGLVLVFGFWFVRSFTRFVGRGERSRGEQRDVHEVRTEARRRF